MRLFSLLFLALTLTACGKPSPNTLKIGTVAGPETQLVEVAQTLAKKRYDLNIKIIEFNDYNLPNEALSDGSLDANVYQHLPYLKAASKANHYDFAVIGKTFIYPTALYSKKITHLNSLPDKAVIAIPNDPSNEARALVLLEEAGLIKLNANTEYPTAKDIVSNPKALHFKELDAAQLPRILDDVTAAVINTNFAIPAGLNPKTALFSENKDSPYANIIVARRDNEKKEQLALFVKAMNSNAVREKAQEIFGDAAIPAWSSLSKEK